MQIIPDHKESGSYLRHLGTSLLQDSFCWTDWYGIHLKPEPGAAAPSEEEAWLAIAGIVRSLLPGEDGSLMRLRDGSLFAVYRRLDLLDCDTADKLVEEVNHQVPPGSPRFMAVCFPLWEERDVFLDFVGEYAGPLELTVRTSAANKALIKMLIPHLGEALDVRLSAGESTMGRHDPHIMVVDDDPLTRRMIEGALGKHHRITAVSDAAEALEKHFALRPDIVFLDIGLRDADGFMVLNHIRHYDPQCMVIMFSGNSYFDNRVRAMSAGAGGFLAKPFDRSAFTHYIDDWKRRKAAG